MEKSVEFILKLYDDDSVREKLRVMDNMEAMFDDERNFIPDEYFDMVGSMELGKSLKIRIEVLDADPTTEKG